MWCLASHHSNPNVLFSGGWDAAVLAWDVSVGRMIERVNDRCHLLLNYFLIFLSSLPCFFFSFVCFISLHHLLSYHYSYCRARKNFEIWSKSFQFHKCAKQQTFLSMTVFCPTAFSYSLSFELVYWFLPLSKQIV